MTATGKRAYHSESRAHRARETRRAVVAAAGEHFVSQGYAASTIDAIAERARVSRKTVTAVGGKGTLLKLAWDWTLVGDDEPVAMADRPVVLAMIAESDPRRLVQMWARMTADVSMRATPLARVLISAADVDAAAAGLLTLIRDESHAGATAFVAHLAAIGGLRPGVEPVRAADICWALVNSGCTDLLTNDRGWSLDEYAEWLDRVVAASLLR